MKRSKSPDPEARYQIGFKEDALVEWNALDGSVKDLFRAVLKKRLQNPYVPGSELHGDLRDCYKIKMRKIGYRLIYTVEEEESRVVVVAIGKRENSAAYLVAVARLLEEQATGAETEPKKQR